MKTLWTCAGENFGYLTGRNVRTLDGHHIGVMVAGEVFGPDGLYLGEIVQECYLITKLSKKLKRRRKFVPCAPGRAMLRRWGKEPLNVPSGDADFPPPSYFHRSYVEELLRAWVEEDE